MSRRPENDPESPSSTDEPSPKKSKRGVHKRVVSVPIGGGDVEGSNKSSRGGDSYPPSDSWAWRKYGQKPIKGSPYPRGYYRCSSSKGCPARKQVERSRLDPNTLIVTYASDHNHPIPAKSNNHHHLSIIKPEPETESETTMTIIETSTPKPEPETETETEETSKTDTRTKPEPETETETDDLVVVEPSQLTSDCWGFDRAISEWFVGDDVVLESPTVYEDDDAAAEVSGEDESLFGDLGELPECALVFRRRIALLPCGDDHRWL